MFSALSTHGFVNVQEIQTMQSDGAIPPAVSGWLLVLCLLLTFSYPATSLYHISIHTIPMLITAHSPSRIVLLTVYSALFIVMAVYSFLAGLKLWLVKPDAVRFAKRYLLAYLIADIAYFVFWIIIIRPHQTASFAEMGWSHVVSPIPSTALWYFYLEHSKRVRATYA